MQIQEKPTPITDQAFWETFTSAPHRMMFFAGAIQLVLPVLFWAVELIGRHTELWSPLAVLIPATWAHGFIMLYGVFIFFIFGFLMTVYPRWMNGELIPKESYISTFAWMTVGMLVFEAGIFLNLTMAAAGIAIFLFGWAIGQWSLFKVYRTAPAQNKNYETILNFALSAGWISAASFLLWMVTDNWVFQQFSIKAGIWIFLLPILFTVGHRMIPFFSSSVLSEYTIYQPRWTLQVMITACIAHVSLDILELPQWLFLADLPLAAVALLHTIKWQIKRSFIECQSSQTGRQEDGQPGQQAQHYHRHRRRPWRRRPGRPGSGQTPGKRCGARHSPGGACFVSRRSGVLPHIDSQRRLLCQP